MFDDIEMSPGAGLLAVIAFIIGMIVSKSMGAGIIFRLIVATICGIAGFFTATIIASRG